MIGTILYTYLALSQEVVILHLPGLSLPVTLRPELTGQEPNSDPPILANIEAFNGLSVATIAAVLDQSVDCVKIIGLDERIKYMNQNGRCAMEVENSCSIDGVAWIDFWPVESHPHIVAAYQAVQTGSVARFDAYCPTNTGKPRWWNVSLSPLRADDDRLVAYLSISRDITEAEMARQALEVAAAELRHRLKNSFAIMGSLMTSFARGDAARQVFAREITERLAAMATAQTLFVSRGHEPCRITDLIPALAIPFDRPNCPVIIGRLDDAVVDQGRADAIALVFGELAINSGKHGAFNSIGAVHIEVESSPESLLVRWSERSESKVAAHSRKGGQGLSLMQRIMQACHGAITISWFDYGLDAELKFVGSEHG